MYIALDKEQKRISINAAVQGDVFFCPVCLERMFVKAGAERARHFSHYLNSECNDSWNGQYDMSDWHILNGRISFRQKIRRLLFNAMIFDTELMF